MNLFLASSQFLKNVGREVVKDRRWLNEALSAFHLFDRPHFVWKFPVSMLIFSPRFLHPKKSSYVFFSFKSL